MTKKIIFGKILLIFILIGFFGLYIIHNFEIFDEPNELIIKQECDYDGLRKVILSEIPGNATTNNSFHINASNDCIGENRNLENIFTVSSTFLTNKDIKFYWKSFDTITIIFDKKFKKITQKKVTEKINPKIIIEYIEK